MWQLDAGVMTADQVEAAFNAITDQGWISRSADRGLDKKAYRVVSIGH
jgi:hypothetical protein